MNAPEFTLAHREAMAERLAEEMERAVLDIGFGRGRIGGVRADRELKLDAVTPAEMRALICGLRCKLTTMHDWIEHQFCGASDCGEAHAACVRHGVSYDMLHAELDGAEGEWLARRHPERKSFPGKFRALSAWLGEIRATRLAINCELPPGTTLDFNARYDLWTAERDRLADEWMGSPRRMELGRQLGDWGKFVPKSREESEARQRVKHELDALEAVCRRRRREWWKRREEADRRALQEAREGRQVAA